MGMTYQEIGDFFGVSHTQIQRDEARALAKLRANPLAKELLKSLEAQRRSNNLGTLIADEGHSNPRDDKDLNDV
jgi:DNA-directed RNA polymerase sigma subunit (sigma70/sigma32)